MRIVNLIEDTEGDVGLCYEHGLCFYIETEHHKVLLDTGASEAFAENAKKKGIALSLVDTVVISHGHYDHAGGVMAFSKLNSSAKIYINKNAKADFYSIKSTEPKYIGMDKSIEGLPQAVFIDGNIEIDDELSIFTDAVGRRFWPSGNLLLKKKSGDSLIQDEFEHEMYLVVNDKDKKVLLSGCAHNGILNILNKYRELYGGVPTHVISGFHTTKNEYDKADEKLIQEIASELAKTDTQYFSGHCTGEYPMRIMKSIMGDKLTVIHSGDDIF